MPAFHSSTTRRRFLMLLLGGSALAGAPRLALAMAPERYVEGLAGKVMALARSSRGKVALKRAFLALLTRNANMKAIARFALGKYLRRMPRSMQAEYYRLVLDYIAGLFVYYRKDLAGRSVKIGKVVRRGKWITVESQLIFPGGRKAPVKWRIRASGGSYKVGDVNIQGIWLSLRMRDQFVSILNRNKGDFSALLKYLRENAVV